MKVLFFLVLFYFPSTFAAEPQCRAHSNLLAADVQKEIANKGNQVVTWTQNKLWYYNQQQMGVQQNIECSKIVDQLKSAAHPSAVLMGLKCGKRGEPTKLTFRLADYAVIQERRASKHIASDPTATGEALTKMNEAGQLGSMPRTIAVEVDIHEINRELAFPKDGFAFKYDRQGQVTEFVTFAKNENGKLDLNCRLPTTEEFKTYLQASFMTPTVQAFSLHQICNRCEGEVKAYAEVNAEREPKPEQVFTMEKFIQSKENEKKCNLLKKSATCWTSEVWRQADCQVPPGLQRCKGKDTGMPIPPARR